MSMWRGHGGFLTNYLADLAFPPWYYVVIRSSTTIGKKPPALLRLFGASAGRAAISIVIAGVVYELGRRFIIIPGTFDIWDIAAYGIGPTMCYLLERMDGRNPSGSSESREQ